MYLFVFLALHAAFVCAEVNDELSIEKQTFLTEQDFANAKLIQQSENETIDDSAMYGDLFEGDILGGIPELAIKNPLIARNAMKKESSKWPGGRVPYTISDDFTQSEKAVIASGLDEIMSKTCIKFVPKEDSDKAYVFAVKKGGCSSFVGRLGSPQELTLGRGCLHKGIVAHEFMHALGFYHEQSRQDRDGYVTIHFDNVRSGREGSFASYSLNEISHLGTAYDYGSVMHYGRNAFSTSWKDTITPRERNVEIGQRRGLSANDARKINIQYGCDSGPKCPPDNVAWCAQVKAQNLCYYGLRNCATTCGC